MKFLAKINRNYFLLLIPVLLIVSVGGYLVLKMIIIEEAQESLEAKESLIREQILLTGVVPNLYPLLEVERTDSDAVNNPRFRIIHFYNKPEDEMEPYLEYSNVVRIGNVCYSVKIRQFIIENEDLAATLGFSFFVLLLTGLSIAFFFTKRANRTIWKEFEKNLKKIEGFGLSGNKKLSLQRSDIDEFDRLNNVINQMTLKIRNDYQSLKEFTENASHEIQTPLSITLLNLEEILQHDPPEDVFRKVVSSMNALKRLSTLNQSLVLLTKIENRQFIAEKLVDLGKLTAEKLNEFEPLLEIKGLKISFSGGGFMIKMNDQLASVLVSNLLSNAVKHNIDGGIIRIAVGKDEFKICNTGTANSLTDETIFNRFAKGNAKSYGLGLAIVKNICETHDLTIRYLKNDLHCFVIRYS